MNPFGITEVDVPGVLGAYETGQNNRLLRMARQQQVQAAERQADREQGIREVMARVAGGGAPAKGGVAGAYAQPADVVGQSVAAGSGGMVGTPAPTAPPATQAPAARQSFREAIPQLLALGMDPTQVHALAQLDDQQSAAAVQRWQQIGPLYVEARRLPYEQRRAYIASVTPQLAQLGISPEEIQGFDPTDANLSSHIALGTTMAQALEPRYMTVEGEVLDQRSLPHGAPGDPVVYRSQYIATPAGLAERPGGGVTHPAPQTRQARNRQTGQVETLQFNPQNNQWEPVAPPAASQAGSADLDNWNNAGRAGPQGPRTFR